MREIYDTKSLKLKYSNTSYISIFEFDSNVNKKSLVTIRKGHSRPGYYSITVQNGGSRLGYYSKMASKLSENNLLLSVETIIIFY